MCTHVIHAISLTLWQRTLRFETLSETSHFQNFTCTGYVKTPHKKEGNVVPKPNTNVYSSRVYAALHQPHTLKTITTTHHVILQQT